MVINPTWRQGRGGSDRTGASTPAGAPVINNAFRQSGPQSLETRILQAQKIRQIWLYIAH